MQTIYIDISQKSVLPVVQAKQNDVGRKFKAIFTDFGVPYNFADDVVLSVFYSGPSGEGNYTHIGDKSAFEVSGNSVIVELISQMLTNRGNGLMCLVLSRATGETIGTWNINYEVEAVPGSDSEAAKDYYTAFSKAASEFVLYSNEAKEASESASQSASNAAQSAQNAAASAEDCFVGQGTTGTTGTIGWVPVYRISVATPRSSQPFSFLIFQRHMAFPSAVSIRFENDAGTDPGVASFTYTWGDVHAALNKSAPGVWDMYVLKTEAWDQVDIIGPIWGSYMVNLGVSVERSTADQIQSLPSTAIEATRASF